MNPITQTYNAAFVAWMRPRGGRWRQVAKGQTYEEAVARADEYLRTMDNPPQHAETYTGPAGSNPPMIRRRRTA